MSSQLVIYHQQQHDKQQMCFFTSGDGANYSADQLVRTDAPTTGVSAVINPNDKATYLFFVSDQDGAPMPAMSIIPQVNLGSTGQVLSGSAPSAVMYGKDLLGFWTMNDNTLAFSKNGGPLTSVPGSAGLATGPTAVVFMNVLYIFYCGTDNAMWFLTTTDLKTWTPTEVPNIGKQDPFFETGAVVFTPAGSSIPQLFVFANYPNVGIDYISTADGVKWQSYPQIPNLDLSDGPAAVVFNKMLMLFHTGGSGSSTVWYTSSVDGVNWTDDEKIISGVGASYRPSALVADM